MMISSYDHQVRGCKPKINYQTVPIVLTYNSYIKNNNFTCKRYFVTKIILLDYNMFSS